MLGVFSTERKKQTQINEFVLEWQALKKRKGDDECRQSSGRQQGEHLRPLYLYRRFYRFFGNGYPDSQRHQNNDSKYFIGQLKHLL